jgi:hypothetical protein
LLQRIFQLATGDGDFNVTPFGKQFDPPSGRYLRISCKNLPVINTRKLNSLP